MLDLMQRFNAEMNAGPAWVVIWVNIMVVILALAIPFSFVRREARVVLIGTLLGMVGTMMAYHHFGYQRILGIGHILFWTPTVIYLWLRRASLRPGDTLSGKWLVLAGLVMALSLVFDYADLVRWLMGSRGA